MLDIEIIRITQRFFEAIKVGIQLLSCFFCVYQVLRR